MLTKATLAIILVMLVPVAASGSSNATELTESRRLSNALIKRGQRRQIRGQKRRQLSVGSQCTEEGPPCGTGLECECSRRLAEHQVDNRTVDGERGRRLFGAPAASTCQCQASSPTPPPPPPTPPPTTPPPPPSPAPLAPAPVAERAPGSLFGTDTVVSTNYWKMSYIHGTYRPFAYMWAIYANTYAQTAAITFEASCTFQRLHSTTSEPSCGVTDGKRSIRVHELVWPGSSPCLCEVGLATRSPRPTHPVCITPSRYTGTTMVAVLCYGANLFEGYKYSVPATKYGNDHASQRAWGSSGPVSGTSSEIETISMKFTYPSGTGTGVLEGKYASMSSYVQLMNTIPRFDFTKDLGGTFLQYRSNFDYVLQGITLGTGSMTGAQLAGSAQGAVDQGW